MSFTGEFHHTLDDKGRLIVPARHRAELDNDLVVLTAWRNDTIAMWSGANWTRLEEQLLRERRDNPSARDAIRLIGATASQEAVDKQGRITVPPGLRELAGIERDCVVIGEFDHAEIWNPERYERQKASVRLAEVAEQLGF